MAQNPSQVVNQMEEQRAEEFKKNTLLYFVKLPVPGKVKTRLARTIGTKKAATAYRMLAEANLMANLQVNQHFSLRCGVQGLLLEGVALAPENFNTADPFAARTPIINTNGNAFYTGVTAGGEFTW